MQELIDSLERCVMQSTFVSSRMGKIGWNDYRRLFLTKRWDNPTWMLWKLEIDDVHVTDLEARLEPVLAEFMHTGTGRIGNGLFLLLGGLGTWAHPTVAEFARTLIRGAVRCSAQQVTAQLLGWASGEPLRFRISALLEGADIEEALQLAEGIRVWKLPNSAAALPASLPYFHMVASVTAFIGGVVISIDCEMSPNLYLPDEDEIGRMSFSRRWVGSLYLSVAGPGSLVESRPELHTELGMAAPGGHGTHWRQGGYPKLAESAPNST